MIGQSVVWHDPQGVDRPGVVSAEEGKGRFTLLILSAPSNYTVEHVARGGNGGMFEVIKQSAAAPASKSKSTGNAGKEE